MDVDGTLTDGKIHISEKGELFKSFDVKDGYAIAKILPQYGIEPVIITGRESKIVLNRCKELGITEVYQNCSDKENKMLSVAMKFGIKPDENGVLRGTAYIGDDVSDLTCMQMVEVSGCPADSAREIVRVANFVCSHSAGNGAVREFIDYLVSDLFCR